MQKLRLGAALCTLSGGSPIDPQQLQTMGTKVHLKTLERQKP